MSYECFVGLLDEDYSPEIIYADETVATWSEARWWMIERLVRFLDDECTVCRDNGRRALVDLILTEGSLHTMWYGEVDGNTYRIKEVSP